MGKFRIKMKLQGLELDIEGSRDDMPLINRNIGQQLIGLLQPAGAIVEGGDLSPEKPTLDLPVVEAASAVRRQRRRKATSAAGTAETKETGPLDWTHDPKKYGNPDQGWSTLDKALWTLYVLAETNTAKELSVSRIAKTFNKHFRQARTVAPSNVSRDLGKQKLGANAMVGEDATQSPSVWFLTADGRKHVQALIAGIQKQAA